MEKHASLDRRRYLLLAASCLINLCIGSMYAWSVFASPLAAKLSALGSSPITAGTLSIVFTCANAVGPITMIGGGAMIERLGPKWVVFIGGLMFGGGMMLSALATSVLGLMLSYGLMLGLGVGLVYGCTISNTIKFFPDKRGLAGGLTVAAYGLSSVLVPPVANALIQRTGIDQTILLLGALFTVVICAGSALMRRCPVGYTPAGYTPGVQSNASAQDKTTRQMLKSAEFYLMIAMLTLGAFSGLMLISQASPIAQNMIGMSTGAAAMIVSALALFNAGGRILSGYISDKIGRVKTLSIVFILCVAGCLMLYASGPSTAWLFVMGICVTGICFGSLMGIFPGFTVDRFGSRYNGVNYGVMFIGFALAGIVGPLSASGIYQAMQQYQPAFLIAGLCAFIGFVLCKVFQRKYT